MADVAEQGPVLVAEDSNLLAALLRDAFQAHGVAGEVKVYKDGHSFLAAYAEFAARQKPVRLLVVDIHMPGLNGLEAGREIRTMERNAKQDPTPMIFFSSSELSPEIESAVADCFPARFVRKEEDQGPATVAIVGARMIRGILDDAGQ